MSCSTCKEVINPDIPFAVFDFTPTKYVAQESFVRLPHKPARGWGVTLPIKGSSYKVDGPNPRHVAHVAIALYKLNGFQVNKNTLWFNLNLQWLERTPAKYHTTPLAELLEIANPESVVNDDKHAEKKIDPDSWTTHFWIFIKAYLESDTYSWEILRGFLKQYKQMLNPTENALLGDSNRYLRFTLAVDKLERNPAYTSEKAKIWVNEQI